MAELIHKSKTILPQMRVAQSGFALAYGLMFASKKKVRQGLCLVFPGNEDVQYGATITMWFCFFKYEILFINSNKEVVDKVILRPWRMSYIPKEKCKYVIESLPNTFELIKIGDRIKIKF
ncbi:MAG: DUF192 domain-containing protein [Candidatus Nanoarchaeia archaeon]